MATINCPKCQKVFMHAKYPSKAKEHLERHLARKNPCDGSVAEYVYERRRSGTAPNIETLDLTGLVEALDGNIRFCHVTSFVFRFLNDLNKFAVVPNVKVNEVYYVTDDKLMCTRLAEFVIEFWHKVMVAQVNPVLQARWPRFGEWRAWLTSHYVFTNMTVAHINLFLASDVYKQIKYAIRGHLKSVTREERFRTRSNMGTGEAEQRRIAFQTAE
jgi:hypothetical protein